jgi:hypothetical protein
MIDVSKHLLLSVVHTLNYSIAFNEVNAALNDIQTRNFEQAGQNILDFRDPYTEDTQGRQDLHWLLELCQVNNDNEAIQLLRDDDSKKVLIAVDDETRLVSAMHNAITRYNERHCFFMLEPEYETDLIRTLGKEGASTLRAEIHALLNKRMTCGNADSSIKDIKRFLDDNKRPYEKPGYPYLAKHDARFAEMYARIRESVNQMTRREQP